MICYSTKNKKHIGIKLNTSSNLDKINSLLDNNFFIYHIWNVPNYIDLLNSLNHTTIENNTYLHVNSINELSVDTIDKINKCGIILSIPHNDTLTQYKCLLPKIQRLHIEFSTSSLESSINSINELAQYYYMINKYYFAFSIDISKFTNINADIDYLISTLKKYKNDIHIIKYYFFHFLDKLSVIEINNFIPSYKDIGYVINDNNIEIYTNNGDNKSSLQIIDTYLSLYEKNDICENCNGFLFCSKLKELPYCLNNNFLYKHFYTKLAEAIVTEGISL